MPETTAHRARGFSRTPVTAGFTLIEMMVVVLVIGIVAAAVIPNLGGSADSVRLESAARRTADLMDFCYHAAATTGRVHALLYDNTTRRFDVVSEPPPVAVDPVTGEAVSDPSLAAGAVAAGAVAPVTDSATAAVVAPDAGGAADTAALTGEGALIPVSVPGYVDRALPQGIAISTMETYEGDLLSGAVTAAADPALAASPAPAADPAAGAGTTDAAGAGETTAAAGAPQDATGAPFRILFFPDGTTEFAKLEIVAPDGQRRQLWLNGMGGSVTIVNPDIDGEADLSSMIVDEDSLDTTGEDGTGTTDGYDASTANPGMAQ